MYLSPADFNEFLAKMGQAAAWSPAFLCPCRHPRSGAADPACPQCHGVGVYWGAPVDCVVAISGQKLQQEWNKFGGRESGDQVVTLPSDTPAYAMGQYDRLVMTQSSIPFNLILRPEDHLRDPVVAIDSATWFAAGVLVSADPPPTVTENGTLIWWGAIDPPAGAQIALSGRKHPEFYLLQEYPQDRAHHGGLDLPRRVVLRKMDLFRRAG